MLRSVFPGRGGLKRSREEVNMSTKTANAVALKVRALEDDGAGCGADVDHGVDGVVDGAVGGVAGGDRWRSAGDAGRGYGADHASDEVVRALRDKLERYRRHRARRAGWVRRFVPTGLWPLDERLPHGGLPCGAITEIYADFAGVGSMTLALRMVGGRDEGTKGRRDEEDTGSAVRITGEGSRDQGIKGSRGKVETVERRNGEMGHGGGDCRRPIVVVDAYGDFYPPGVVPFGISLDRLIVLRVRNEKDALWATEQSLRCSAVAAVVAPLERIDERDSRRLQLAAETTGCVGIVLRPMHRRGKSFAAVQMLVEGSDEGKGSRDSALGGQAPGIEGSRARDEAIPISSGQAPRRSDGGAKVETSKHQKVEMAGAMLPRSGSMSTYQDCNHQSPERQRGGRTAEDNGASRCTLQSSGFHGGAALGRGTRSSEPRAQASGPGDVAGFAVRSGVHVDRSAMLNSPTFEEGVRDLRDGYFCRITLLAVREGMPTSPCWVDLYHETGTCDVRSLPVDRAVARTEGSRFHRDRLRDEGTKRMQGPLCGSRERDREETSKRRNVKTSK